MQLKTIQTVTNYFGNLLFLSNFGLSQAKGNLIFILINFIYELTRELPHNLKLTILGYHEIDRKSVGKHAKAQSLFQNLIFGNSENLTSVICSCLVSPAFLTFCQIFRRCE